jgi:hypothetical protein
MHVIRSLWRMYTINGRLHETVDKERERVRERYSVSVCVCVCVRERDSMCVRER